MRYVLNFSFNRNTPHIVELILLSILKYFKRHTDILFISFLNIDKLHDQSTVNDTPEIDRRVTDLLNQLIGSIDNRLKKNLVINLDNVIIHQNTLSIVLDVRCVGINEKGEQYDI